MNSFLAAFISVLCSVAAQFFLRAGVASIALPNVIANPALIGVAARLLFNKFVIIGFVFYGLGALLWLVVLARWEVSKAYPLVGIGFLLTSVVGAFLGEQVTGFRVAGAVMICAGVLIVART